MGMALMEAFVDPDASRFKSGLPPVTIGSLTRMISLRKVIADGTAQPAEIQEYESESAARQKGLDDAQVGAVEDIIAKRDKKLFITGMWGALYPFAEAVRAQGYSAKDFHPENGVYLGGGLKRAQLPDNYREYVYETFNLSPEFIYQMYGMQELQTSMPRCQLGLRYHIPPWLVPLPLDKTGDALLPDAGKGRIEGRAAFFDLSMDGRWGGVISGDHIEIDYEPLRLRQHVTLDRRQHLPLCRPRRRRQDRLRGHDRCLCAGHVRRGGQGCG